MTVVARMQNRDPSSIGRAVAFKQVVRSHGMRGDVFRRPDELNSDNDNEKGQKNPLQHTECVALKGERMQRRRQVRELSEIER